MFGLGSFNLYEIAIGFVVLVLSIGIHEASHALAAYKLGDPTAKQLGRLTLNPIAHMDPLGTLMILMTMIGGIGIGWGKPCPVNPYNLRMGPKNGMAIVSLAGPLANLAIATTLAIPLRFGGIYDPLLQSIVLFAVTINIALTVFNLIPIPPLDGFKVLLGFLPNKQAYALGSLDRYGFGILFIIIFMGQWARISILGIIMEPPMAVLQWIILGGHFPRFF